MITGISITTDLPDIESMLVVGSSAGDSNIDINTNVVFSELTEEQQQIYTDAIALVTDKNYNEITNTTSRLEVNRITSDVLEEGNDSIDFEALSESDKDKLRSLLALFITLTTSDAE